MYTTLGLATHNMIHARAPSSSFFPWLTSYSTSTTTFYIIVLYTKPRQPTPRQPDAVPTDPWEWPAKAYGRPLGIYTYRYS